jgi:hypothetical protein
MEGIALDIGRGDIFASEDVSNVFFTDVVPAPDEPVIDMMG